MVIPSLRICCDLMFIPDPSYPDPVLYVKTTALCNGSHPFQGSAFPLPACFSSAGRIPEKSAGNHAGDRCKNEKYI
jgi:hypothetical protein